MKIVEVKDIPIVDNIIDTPINDLIDVLKIFQELQILCEENNGIGISAVQAGIPWKLFLVKGDGSLDLIKKDQYGCFLNCDYKSADDDKILSLEGCLSIKNKDGKLRYFQLERFKNINVFGSMLTTEGSLKIENFSLKLGLGQQSIVFQHEIDHQKGKLISEIGKEIFIW